MDRAEYIFEKIASEKKKEDTGIIASIRRYMQNNKERDKAFRKKHPKLDIGVIYG